MFCISNMKCFTLSSEFLCLESYLSTLQFFFGLESRYLWVLFVHCYVWSFQGIAHEFNVCEINFWYIRILLGYVLWTNYWYWIPTLFLNFWVCLEKECFSIYLLLLIFKIILIICFQLYFTFYLIFNWFVFMHLLWSISKKLYNWFIVNFVWNGYKWFFLKSISITHIIFRSKFTFLSNFYIILKVQLITF